MKYTVNYKVEGSYTISDDDLEGTDVSELSGQDKLDAIAEMEEQESLPGVSDILQESKVTVIVTEQ